jgi:geranylgeranyl reductase family protein
VVHVHDAIVVGAGPGGSATGHGLSAHGLDVLLLDRAEFPRDKTCGDGLTPRALRALDRMGLLSTVSRHGCPVEGYEVVAPRGHSTRAPIAARPGALVIPRKTLDHLLLRQATASGARFEGGVTVERVAPTSAGVVAHASDGRAFHGRVAVIATGAATGVLKRSGILRRQPRAMLAARAYFDDLPRDVARSFQLRFDGAPIPGYGWIFPVARRTANVGVAFVPGRRVGTATEALGRFTQRLAPVLSGSRRVGPVKGYPIRTDFLRAPTLGERTLLVGEAAGLVNPLTGEGIDYALESGLLAAGHLARLFETGDLSAERLGEYDALLHARFDKLFRFGEWIRDWYGKAWILNVLVAMANRRPELRQLLTNIVLGEREPRGYGPATMLARLVLYLARTSFRRHPHD